MSSAETSLTNPGEDPVVLVTGGAKRVGAAIAIRLAEAGYDVAITFNTSTDAAREVVRCITDLGRQAVAIHVDLSQPDAAERVHHEFTRHFDRLHALINNASIFSGGKLAEMSPEIFDNFMAVNARGPLMLIRQFAPMLAAGVDVNQPHTLGRVVNFVDIHVMGQPLPGYVAYNASKAALHEITMTLSQELAPLVTVNGIAPGAVAWPESYTQEDRRSYMKRVPLGRPGTPNDAATAVLFLVRDADYCTGQIIKVDGGRLLT